MTPEARRLIALSRARAAQAFLDREKAERTAELRAGLAKPEQTFAPPGYIRIWSQWGRPA